MAAIAPPSASSDDALTQKFTDYVAQKPGAQHYTLDDIQAALEAEKGKSYGTEVLHASIDAFRAKQESAYKAWKHADTTKAYWSSGAIGFVLQELDNPVIQQKVKARFPGAHFDNYEKSVTVGTLFYNESEDLDGKTEAVISAIRNYHFSRVELRIDWKREGNFIASFVCNDFPFDFPHAYIDTDSEWSSGGSASSTSDTNSTRAYPLVGVAA